METFDKISCVTLTDRKLQLLENIVRLRQAQRRSPGDAEIAAVRSSLEEELGETVSQRLAARFLGISHAALSRWIKAGDLPLVQNPQGRQQIPVAPLLELHDAVNRERTKHPRWRHVLEPALTRGRRRAQRMQPAELVGVAPERAGGHNRADRRSLAYHRALAPRLSRSMVAEALHRVWKWRDQGKLDPRYAQQWEEVLHRPLPEIKRLIGEDSPRARDLRQNSPFAGMLSEPERHKLLEAIR